MSTTLMWEDIEAGILEAGFSKVHQYEVLATFDQLDLDEYLLYFWQGLLGRTITSDELRHAFMTVSPGGKWKQSYCIAILRGVH